MFPNRNKPSWRSTVSEMLADGSENPTANQAPLGLSADLLLYLV